MILIKLFNFHKFGVYKKQFVKKIKTNKKYLFQKAWSGLCVFEHDDEMIVYVK